MFKITIIGVRTHKTQIGTTGRYYARSKEVQATLKYHEGSNKTFDSSYFEIIEGGVTGYEGFCVGSIDKVAEFGWTACAGTTNRLDELHFPSYEMRKVKSAWEEYQKQLKKECSWLFQIKKFIRLRKELGWLSRRGKKNG
jgi:hypothetical protein